MTKEEDEITSREEPRQGDRYPDLGAAIPPHLRLPPQCTWHREMPCPRTVRGGGVMTTVPRRGRRGLPRPRPRGDGLSGHEVMPPFRATGDELGHETWTGRRAVVLREQNRSAFVATVLASGWYGRFHASNDRGNGGPARKKAQGGPIKPGRTRVPFLLESPQDYF